MGEDVATLVVETPQAAARPRPHLYYPAEGFGAVYRRVMVNDYFSALIRRTAIRSVAELPLDSYGIVGAGSLLFTELGCEVTLVSDDRATLRRAQALMEFNQVEGVRYLYCPLERVPVAPDTFDLTWSFDRLQATSDPAALLAELCRVSKATLVSVPNVDNYGQLPHYLYHRLTGTTCEYVGPRGWMLHAPIREALLRGGMEIVDEGWIDVPWWPGFPELPNLVRGLLGRAPVEINGEGVPEASPEVVPPAALPQMMRRVARSALIERGRWPAVVRRLFAHNLFVLGCKPEHRRALGL